MTIEKDVTGTPPQAGPFVGPFATLEDVERALSPLSKRLAGHSLYATIDTAESVRTFMEHHVFAVWDFMALLKALQRELTSVDRAWSPRSSAATRRFINEIVLGEESDLDGSGGWISHYELYLEAMRQCGARTASISDLVALMSDGLDLHASFAGAQVPLVARRFVETTFGFVDSGDAALIAGAFHYGREDLIPSMFRQMVHELNRRSLGAFSRFLYYLERHIDVDQGEHGPLARRMLLEIVAQDPTALTRIHDGGRRALEARLAFWDAIRDALAALDHRAARLC